MLAVPKYNERMLKGNVTDVKTILSKFTYPYIRRIAGAHGSFSEKEYRKWLEQASEDELARALKRLAQLNQTKVYLFWEKLQGVN